MPLSACRTDRPDHRREQQAQHPHGLGLDQDLRAPHLTRQGPRKMFEDTLRSIFRPKNPAKEIAENAVEKCKAERASMEKAALIPGVYSMKLPADPRTLERSAKYPWIRLFGNFAKRFVPRAENPDVLANAYEYFLKIIMESWAKPESRRLPNQADPQDGLRRSKTQAS